MKGDATPGRCIVGVDVGGTFTDLTLWDPVGDVFAVHKVPTDDDDFAHAILDGFSEMLAAHDLRPGRVDVLFHATTLASNAIIERKGARTGLLATKGFRDLLVLGTEQPYEIYDLFLEYPAPLVPRRLTAEIDERTAADGRVVRPVDRAEVRARVTGLRTRGIEALALCFLHSYANPENEQAAAAVVREHFPDLSVSVSSEVSPEIREFERASTTAANAYVKGVVGRYLEDLEKGLRTLGMEGSVYVMLSGGGTAALTTAAEHPVRMVESGPAAGGIAAQYHGLQVGEKDLLSFDMGGTTAKVALVRDGRVGRTASMEVARTSRFQQGSGLPLRAPALDLIEVGAGGGSIAHTDAAGRLRVGPVSAGAAPGPACYGRGGEEPTVTDALVILGYLGTESFLGGRMRLDADAAARAIDTRIAGPYRMSVPAAAWGIYSLVVENMAAAARVHTAEKAVDPRRCSLIAFGGAGPATAGRVARVLRARKVIVPPGAGVASAFGLLVAPVAFDYSRSRPERLDAMDRNAVAGLLADLRTRAAQALAEAGIGPGEATYRVSADMCLLGQSYEVNVELEGGIEATSGGDLAAAFHRAYEARYGRAGLEFPIQVLTWRLAASGAVAHGPSLARAQARSLRRHDAAAPGSRPAYFPDLGFVDCPVHSRYALSAGTVLAGPAVIEEDECTTVVAPGETVAVDEFANLVIERTA